MVEIRYLILLMLIPIIGCAQNLHIVWDAPDYADRDSVETYIVYKWEGDSATAWDSTAMDSIGTLPHTFNYSGPYEFATYFQEDAVIRAGCVAVNIIGRRSQMAFSGFYYPPNKPKYVEIEE